MESLERAFEPYRHLDPLGWVGLYRFLPVWAGLVAVGLGALMLLFGGGRLFRVVAGPLGAMIGLVWVGSLMLKLGLTFPQRQVELTAGVLLMALGFAFPPGVVFFAFGVPIGLVAGQLAGPSDWLLGFVPGFMVGGAFGVVLHRVVGAVLSSLVGAWAVTMGLLAALNPFTSAVAFLGANPIPVLAIAGCFAIGGMVFQLFVRASPEEAEQRKHDRTMKRKKDRESKVLEERWSSYSKTHRKAGED